MKVTAKGQVTIPARIRDYLEIKPNSEVDFRISDGTVILVKHGPLREPRGKYESMRGVLKGTQTTQEWMRATRGQ